MKGELKMKSELYCRWCRAIDETIIECEETEILHFSDAMLLVLKCPRCGAATTHYNCGFSEPYLRQVMLKLESDLARVSSDEQCFAQVIDRLYPEMADC